MNYQNTTQDKDKIATEIYCGPEDDQKKIGYFSDFATKYPDEIKILIKGGVLGPGNEEWHNVTKHCLAVAIGADILAEVLHANRENVTKGCLLHDWYKRKEIELMNTLGGRKGYEQASDEDLRLLRKYGVQENIIKITHANVVLSADRKYLESRSLEEKIMHWMDMTTSETEFVDYKKRLSVVEQKKHNVEFSESFRPKFGGKSLFELNYEVIEVEQKKIENLIGLKAGTLIDFIKKKFKERINSSKNK